MLPLTIANIREWLIDNRQEYQRLKSQEFPPLGNTIYFTYLHLHDFIGYYTLKHACNSALISLKSILNDDFSKLSDWTKSNEVLGSEKLLMFEVNYINLVEEVNDNLIKICDGIYTERKPFANILCYCKAFQLLFWDNSIQKEQIPEIKQLQIREELNTMLHNIVVPEAL